MTTTTDESAQQDQQAHDAEREAAEANEAEQGQFSETEIRDEVAPVDIGDAAKDGDEDDRFLARFSRRHFQLKSEMARLDEQHKARMRSLESDLKRLEYVCLPLAESIVRRKLEGKKKKSHRTEWGTFAFRATQPALEITDEPEFIAACTVADDKDPLSRCVLVEHVVKVRKAELNALFAATGEVPVGCVAREAGESFSIK